MTDPNVDPLFEEKKAESLSVVRARLKKISKLLKALDGDAEKLSTFEHCKTWGDVCQTHFSALKRGMTEITLPDPITGEEVKIPLSPELGAAQNIAALYKQHRKMRTGLEKIAERKLEAGSKAEKERQLVSALESATTLEDMERLLPAEPPPKKRGAVQKKKSVGTFPGYRRFVSKQGFEMIVGRNDVQNDDLVRHGKGNDLWLHIRDFPGSHVLVRTAKREVPFETVVEAARLALKFSTKAQDKKGTVVYTYLKYLRRPKDAPPGKVLVTREKTIQVSIE